jgi:putative tryptophan/tyrosine transport system substrate-binding protein
MRRRALVLGLATLASLSVLPFGSLGAQQPRRLPKVAILAPDTPDYANRPVSPVGFLLAALGELGYVDGQNVEYAFRFADHALERLPALAAELVAEQPDVLYTWTSGGARAAAAATSTIPVVIAPVSADTMAALVPDFAQPAGNITGLTLTSLEQREKALQLLKEAVPSMRRVGVLFNPLNPAWRSYPEVLNDAAQGIGVELVRAEARGLPEVDQAFAAMVAQGVDAVFGLSDSTLIGAEPTPPRIFELLAKHRLPSGSDENDFAREGGLLSLGIDEPAVYPGAAQYIHRILKGAKVAELPVVLPSKFILAVNLKTAEQLGLTIPPSILLRADEVIE